MGEKATEPLKRQATSGVVLFGMSPGNGHYTRKNITARLQYLLSTLPDGWTVHPCVPQGPSVWTYLALGYTEIHARRTARKKWRELSKYARDAATDNPRYKDYKWDDLTGGSANASYAAAVERMEKAYETNDAFRRDIQTTTLGVLEKFGKATEECVAVASRYLLEEFAGLTLVREVLGAHEVVLVYHKRFVPLERFLEGAPYGLPPVANFSYAVVNAPADRSTELNDDEPGGFFVCNHDLIKR
ncbi:hypothetical protein BSKO_11155 [Bryopsis sp. KO-2023]|nr:hypothetical protein BSKO_11155 [Bryopsis sp. KO-2023]